MAWSNPIFYIVFLSQILLISYYFPKKLLQRMRYVIETYPPAEYPKLYPRSLDHYYIAHYRLKLASRVILAIGLFLLFSIMFLIDHSTFADDGFISEAFPTAYGLLQMTPLMVLELSEFSHFKLMRNVNESPKRRADLHRRKLKDVVSPLLIIATIALMAASVLVDFYIHDFNVTWSHNTALRTIVMLITNALLFAVGAWQLYGKKLDPYQSSADRVRRAAIGIRSLLYVSMALSVFLMTASADDFYALDALDAIIMSLYFQAIVMLSVGSVLHGLKPDDINFDVYKVT